MYRICFQNTLLGLIAAINSIRLNTKHPVKYHILLEKHIIGDVRLVRLLAFIEHVLIHYVQYLSFKYTWHGRRGPRLLPKYIRMIGISQWQMLINVVHSKMKMPERWRPSLVVPFLSVILPKDVKWCHGIMRWRHIWHHFVTSNDIMHMTWQNEPDLTLTLIYDLDRRIHLRYCQDELLYQILGPYIRSCHIFEKRVTFWLVF